jgi:hypothetical protein
MTAAVESLPVSGGANLARLALQESIRMQRETGELPPLEKPMPGDQPVVRLAGEDIELLVREMRAASTAAATAAARETVKSLMTEENARLFFKVGTTVMREEFKLQAGGWLLDGLWAGAKRLLWVGLFIGLAIWLGGPKVLAMLASSVFGKP